MSAKRILVRAPNWIGDQILAFPFFHYLRAAYPDAHIAAACLPWVEAIQFRGYVDEVIRLEKPVESGFGAKFSTLQKNARAARERGPWDLAISLPDSFSAAWYLFRAGAKRRVGRATDGRSIFLTERVREESGRRCHRAEAYLRLLPAECRRGQGAFRSTDFWGVRPERAEAADVGKSEGAQSEVMQAVLRDEQEQAERAVAVVPRFEGELHWPDAEPQDPPEGDYWIIAPGSAAESRRWSLRSFQELAERVHAETGWKGLILGGPSEAGLGFDLKEALGKKVEDLTGIGSVSSYWKIFAGARFTVANDSGLAHVASLCGSPVQVVWGAGDPRQTQPIGPGKSRLLFNPVDCWPCVRNTCSQPVGNHLACLRGIDPAAVWSEISRGLLRRD